MALHGIETKMATDGIRPLAFKSPSTIGLIGTAPDADAAAFPLNTPVKVVGPRAAALLDTEGDNLGTLLDGTSGIFAQTGANVVIVRVEEGVDEEETLSNIVGASATLTGVHAFRNAEHLLGVKPKVLIAPGYTHQRPSAAANPVVAELKVVAEKLRAIILADGMATTDADALTSATDGGSDRVFVVDPWVQIYRDSAVVDMPASAYIAGLIAHTDATKGYWYSPSNKTINGIVGTSRPIEFSLSDENSQANQLNEGNVATIIKKQGFRLWGNTTTGSDPLTKFLSVRRVLDVVMDMLEDTQLWAMDLPISKNLLRDVQQSVDAALRAEKRRGATLTVKVVLDPELNNVTNFMGGHAYWNVTVEPPAPLQTQTFYIHRDPGAYMELLSEAA